MRLKNTYIPTLIALMAATTASQSLQAQAPARQAFPWSSSSVAPATSGSATRSPTPSVNFPVEKSFETMENSVRQSFDSAKGVADNARSFGNTAMTVGETLYLDEHGNEITREQMQAKMSGFEHNMVSALPSANRVNQTFQSFEQRAVPLRSVDNSVWGKAKNMTAKATSFWKKPSLFKSPEGLTLPSMKTTWAKPKFNEPTTWFSKKATSPITFAALDSLPRKGQFPTSIDGPLNSPTQVASRSATPAVLPNFPPEVESAQENVARSIFTAPEYEVAKSVDNSFDPRR